MRRLAAAATNDEIRSAVEDWVDLLVAEHLDEAVDYLYHGGDTVPMTPDSLGELIQANWWDPPGDSGRHRVTPRSEAEGRGPRFNVARQTQDPTKGDVHYDLPMNGRWSSFTAILDFQVVDNSTVLSLRDLRIL